MQSNGYPLERGRGGEPWHARAKAPDEPQILSGKSNAAVDRHSAAPDGRRRRFRCADALCADASG